MVDFDRSAFVAKFQEEAAELLQRLNEGVINLETRPENRPLVEEMLRDAHTLKGAARMVGLMDLSNIAHRLEDIMVKIRDQQITFTPAMTGVFFEALDAVMFLAENVDQNVDGVVDLDALHSSLGLLAGENMTAGAGTQAAGDSGVAVPQGPEAQAAGAGGVVPSEEPEAGIRTTPASEAEATAASSAAEPKSKSQATIRVRAEDVDRLLNLISETVIAQIKSEQRLGELRTVHTRLAEASSAWLRLRSELSAAAGPEASSPLRSLVDSIDSLLAEIRHTSSAFVKDYGEDVSRSGAVVHDLQEQAMELRMLPADTIFQTFPRAMRDLAKQFKKEVDLVIEGGDTELDKRVLEQINDPLIHILRNAVDHGIEDAETRRARSKPVAGTIKIAAWQEGDRIILEIGDDGGGIDVEKVKATAVRKGYVTDSEAAAMSDREAIYLIFEAGFSTAGIITEISGRGIGMDVVREFIVERLKGSVDVRSEVGKGTTFRMEIPLTLAIIRALLLTVGGRAFALPTNSVEETLRVSPSEIIKAEGREVIRRERRTVPVVSLARILDLPETDRSLGRVPVVTIGFSGQRMGFICDGFVGEQQIVIKPLGSHLRKVDNIAGVTILGAGEVVPILDVPDLMASARAKAGRRLAAKPPAEVEGPRRVLICEDSFTTRELERSIFEAAGYVVDTAADGREGLALLRDHAMVDAVITDVQMPRMTGFQLTRAMKDDERLKAIPVVIVTSLERDEEKAEGIEAGADAYITKSVFNQDTLLDTVERLIH